MVIFQTDGQTGPHRPVPEQVRVTLSAGSEGGMWQWGSSLGLVGRGYGEVQREISDDVRRLAETGSELQGSCTAGHHE